MHPLGGQKIHLDVTHLFHYVATATVASQSLYISDSSFSSSSQSLPVDIDDAYSHCTLRRDRVGSARGWGRERGRGGGRWAIRLALVLFLTYL